jgi:bacterioferritin-associated ferredoxin
MVVKIPADKLCKFKAGIQSIVREKKIKLKDLESVVGLMAFCARAIHSARAFTR